MKWLGPVIACVIVAVPYILNIVQDYSTLNAIYKTYMILIGVDILFVISIALLRSRVAARLRAVSGNDQQLKARYEMLTAVFHFSLILLGALFVSQILMFPTEPAHEVTV